MIVFAVAFVLTALVVAAILVAETFRNTAFCPRRETLVEIANGRCEHRASTCAGAPIGCERECIGLGRFLARARA